MDEREKTDLDEHLRAVLVGGLEPRKVEIVDYDPQWPRRFAHERQRLLEALGPLVRRIEHIGSTSVPGLAAKPVVDIILTVDSVEDESAYRATLERMGYELRVREPGHRAFRTASRDVNLHIWADDDAEVEPHLVFRDHLRANPADRGRYERVKRELATREWPDINHYADAKSAIVKEILGRARR